MQQGSQKSLSLSRQQAQAIVEMMGLHMMAPCGAPLVTEVTQYNHVWRLQCDDEIFYLKCYTKDWYGNDVPRTEYCVRHEQDSYALLAQHGLPTVEVMLARADCNNPLGRPFLVTRALAGVSLNALLAQADRQSFQQLLAEAGRYMRRMHDITFRYPGYVIDDGPAAPPAAGDWQHPAWSAEVCQQNAMARLEGERGELSGALAQEITAFYSRLAERLAPAYQPLRFVQTNMHTHQFFLEQQGADADWRVTGVLDMEVASAGDAFFDLVGFALEMAAFHAPITRWWQPFFAGYGDTPNFELFRDHMLAFGEESFKCFGPAYWRGTRQEILARLLAAQKWETLFAT